MVPRQPQHYTSLMLGGFRHPSRYYGESILLLLLVWGCQQTNIHLEVASSTYKIKNNLNLGLMQGILIYAGDAQF